MTKSMSKREKNFKKKVQKIVNDELQEELEEKTCLIGGNGTAVTSCAIPTGNVSASANFPRIFPLITQGLRQYNNRVGNEILLKHLDITMLLNFRVPVDLNLSNLDYTDAGYGIRVMILRQKDDNDYNAALQNFQGSKLLENGNIVVPGPDSFNGNTLNLFQKINRDQFAVRYDKVFYLNRDLVINQGSVQNYTLGKAPRPVVMKHRLKFGKTGLKLTYGDATSATPTNMPYILCVGYASIASPSAPLNGQIQYSYTAVGAYTDA